MTIWPSFGSFGDLVSEVGPDCREGSRFEFRVKIGTRLRNLGSLLGFLI